MVSATLALCPELTLTCRLKAPDAESLCDLALDAGSTQRGRAIPSLQLKP
jgi:hypothetical protein